MGIYIILLIWLLVSATLKKNKVIYVLSYLFLLLLGGMRGLDVGTDTKNYLELFEILHDDAGTLYVMSFVEPFWVLLNKLVICIYDDYQLVIFLGVFLSITPIFIRAWKSCEFPYATILFYVLLYYYFNSYNIVRQTIALAIIFYSYPFWERNQSKKAIIFTLLAMMFHYTAILAFFIPLVRKIKMQVGFVVFTLPITYLLGALLLPRLIPYLPIVGKYAAYIEISSANLSVTRLLLNVFFLLLFLLAKGRAKDIYFKMFFVGIVLYNLLTFSPALGRCALYFMMAQLIIYSNLSHYRLNTVFVWSMILFYGLFYYSILLNENNCYIIPYVIG